MGEKKTGARAAAARPAAPRRRPSVAGMVENIVGCKWSIVVLELVRQGVNRPGAIERSVDGLTTKVLNERLRKLVGYGILERRVFAEVPPRVEYHLTEFGRKFTPILDDVRRLESELAQRRSNAGPEDPC